MKAIVAIVSLCAFGGIVVAVAHWMSGLAPGERSALGVGFGVLFGASAAVAVVIRERREAAASVSALAALVAALALMVGVKPATHHVAGPGPTKEARVLTPTKPAPGHKGGLGSGGRRAHSDASRPQVVEEAAYAARSTQTSGPSTIQQAPSPASSPSPPARQEAPAHHAEPAGEGASVVMEARGKYNAQATGHSQAEVDDGASAPSSSSATGTTPTTSTSTTTTSTGSTTQRAEGEGNAQASGESTAVVRKGSSLAHLVDARELAEGFAPHAVLAFAAKAPTKRGHAKRASRRRARRRRKHHRKPSSVEQSAQGDGNAQANGHSTAVSGQGNTVDSPTSTSTTGSEVSQTSNSNTDCGNSQTSGGSTTCDTSQTNSNDSNDNTDSGNTSSPIVIVGGSACNVQVGSSGPVTVSGNGSVGSVSSGGVTEINEGGECDGNVQVGSSGSVTVSENGEVGNVSSGNVEERNTSNVEVHEG